MYKYSWGKAGRGQLGTAIDADCSPNPLKIKFKETPRLVSAGFNHSAVLSQEGNVYIWGKGMSNTLKDELETGRITAYLDQFSPRKLEIPKSRKAIDIYSG